MQALSTRIVTFNAASNSLPAPPTKNSEDKEHTDGNRDSDADACAGREAAWEQAEKICLSTSHRMVRNREPEPSDSPHGRMKPRRPKTATTEHQRHCRSDTAILLSSR